MWDEEEYTQAHWGYSYRRVKGTFLCEIGGKMLREPVYIDLQELPGFSVERSIHYILWDAWDHGELQQLINAYITTGCGCRLPRRNGHRDNYEHFAARGLEKDRRCLVQFSVYRDYLQEYLQGEAVEAFAARYTARDAIELHHCAVRDSKMPLKSWYWPVSIPYRYTRPNNFEEMRGMMGDGAVIKFVRHLWRRVEYVTSQVAGAGVSGCRLVVPKRSGILMAMGDGQYFDYGSASQYIFGDTVKQFARPVGSEGNFLLSEFFIQVPVSEKT